MQTRRLRADRPDELAQAAELLRQGKLVAIPTETVYGLASLALDPLAVRAIYAAKGRPPTNPVIVHTSDASEARALAAAWPELAERLSRRFWPGPLTLVLPRRMQVPDEVTAGGPTVALRVPAHPVARELLRLVGAPLAAPSANRAEHVSPTTAEHVLADLDGRIDAVLDAGPCPHGIESTVVRVEVAEDLVRILRAGALPRSALAAELGDRLEPPELPRAAAAVADSPGQHQRHYAPAGEVRLLPAEALAQMASRLNQAGQEGALVWSPEGLAVADACELEVEALPAEAEGYAQGLYAALRALEAKGCRTILIEEVPAAAAWEAVRDRLTRAAG